MLLIFPNQCPQNNTFLLLDVILRSSAASWPAPISWCRKTDALRLIRLITPFDLSAIRLSPPDIIDSPRRLYCLDTESMRLSLLASADSRPTFILHWCRVPFLLIEEYDGNMYYLLNTTYKVGFCLFVCLFRILALYFCSF